MWSYVMKLQEREKSFLFCLQKRYGLPLAVMQLIEIESGILYAVIGRVYPVHGITHCVITLRPVGMQNIAISMSVGLSVYLLVYLKNHMSKPVAKAQSSSDDSAVHYVLLVSWMTSYFHIMDEIQIQAWSLWCNELFAVTRQVAPLNCTSKGEVCYRRLPCVSSAITLWF